MVYNQMNQEICNGSSRKRRERERDRKLILKNKKQKISQIWGGGIDILTQEAYRILTKLNMKRSTPRHTINKLSKVKEI